MAYGKRTDGRVLLFNSASHPLHPWSYHSFSWGGMEFNRLEQCLGYFKACHFKLGEEVKEQVMAAQTGWDVVKALKDHKYPSNADWSGWGIWKVTNLMGILRQMAIESPRFRKALMAVREPAIGFCSKDRSLGTGMDALPTMKKNPELYKPANWEGRNYLGKYLVQLRAELQILEKNVASDKQPEGANEAEKRPKGKKQLDEEAVPLKRQKTKTQMVPTQPLPDNDDRLPEL